jgi:hypothetical protein
MTAYFFQASLKTANAKFVGRGQGLALIDINWGL